MNQNNINSPYQMQVPQNGYPPVSQQQYYYYPGGTYMQQPVYQQPQPKPIGVRGRIVSSEAEILPQEIPMDGTVSLFPMFDFSCIFAKKWLSNGTIETQKYILAIDATPKSEQGKTDIYDLIDERYS